MRIIYQFHLVMRYLLALILLFSFACVEAQQSPGFRLGVEYGTSQMAGEIDSRWEFRQTGNRYSDYESYYGNENVTGEGVLHYAGLKSELSMWQDRLTLASGLRYTHVNERISPAGNASQLYLYHPSGQGIELFRIYRMNESLGYISIPLEADILLLGYLSNWQVYVKGGIQAGLKVHGNTRLDFVSKEMEKYEDEILASVGKEEPSNFFSNVYGSIGLRLILKNGIRLSIEAVSSQVFLTKNNFSLLSSQSLPGVQFMITTPVNLFTSK